jgi:hypothetical protein
MAHVLIRKRFDLPEPTSWILYCECGQIFGSVNANTIENCVGDILDTHREHVRTVTGYLALELDVEPLNPNRTLIQRACDVNQKLYDLPESKEGYP